MPFKSVLRKCCFGMKSGALEFSDIHNVSQDNLVSHVTEMDNFDWSKENVYDNNVTIFRTVSSDSEPDFKFLDHLSSLPRNKKQNHYVESFLLAAGNKHEVEQTADSKITEFNTAQTQKPDHGGKTEIPENNVLNKFREYCKDCDTQGMKNRKHGKRFWVKGYKKHVGKGRLKNGVRNSKLYIVNQDVNHRGSECRTCDSDKLKSVKELLDICNTKKTGNTTGHTDFLDSNAVIDICDSKISLESKKVDGDQEDDYDNIWDENIDDEKDDGKINGKTEIEDHKGDITLLDKSEDSGIFLSRNDIDQTTLDYMVLQNTTSMSRPKLAPSLSVGSIEFCKHLKERRPSFEPRRRSASLVNGVTLEKCGRRMYTEEWVGRISCWQKIYSEENLSEHDEHDYDELELEVNAFSG